MQQADVVLYDNPVPRVLWLVEMTKIYVGKKAGDSTAQRP